jgi:hypothetical protein
MVDLIKEVHFQIFSREDELGLQISMRHRKHIQVEKA